MPPGLQKILDNSKMQTNQTLSLRFFSLGKSVSQANASFLLPLVLEICPVLGVQLRVSLCQGICSLGASRKTAVPKGNSSVPFFTPFLISPSLIHLGTRSYWFQVSCICRIKADTCPETQAGILVSHFSLPAPAWKITGKASKETQFVYLSAHCTSRRRAVCEQG